MTSFYSTCIRGAARSTAFEFLGFDMQEKNNASLSARAKDPMVAARLHGWINGDAAFEFLGFDMMGL